MRMISGVWNRFFSSRIFWPIAALVFMLLVNLIIKPDFFRIEIKEGHLYGNVIDIIKNATPIMLISIGLTLVIATKGIDISVGSLVAIACATAAVMVGGELIMVNGQQQYTTLFPLPLVIIGTLIIASAAGMWNGLLVSRVGMQPIIATLILFVAGRGVAQLITTGQIVYLYYEPFFYLGTGYLFGLPFSLYVVAFVLAVTIFVVRRSPVGMFIESVGINPVASRLSGINAKNVLLWVYVFGGFCAGIAGLVVISNIQQADGNNNGLFMELDAILAVVLGGTSLSGGKFYLMGSMVGALIIQTLKVAIWSFNVPPELALVVQGIVVYIISLLQSSIFRRGVFRMFGGREIVS